MARPPLSPPTTDISPLSVEKLSAWTGALPVLMRSLLLLRTQDGAPAEVTEVRGHQQPPGRWAPTPPLPAGAPATGTDGEQPRCCSFPPAPARLTAIGRLPAAAREQAGGSCRRQHPALAQHLITSSNEGPCSSGRQFCWRQAASKAPQGASHPQCCLLASRSTEIHAPSTLYLPLCRGSLQGAAPVGRWGRGLLAPAGRLRWCEGCSCSSGNPSGWRGSPHSG